MKIQIQKSKVILLLSLVISLGIIFAGIIYLDNNLVREVDITDMEPNQENVSFCIDAISDNNNYISVRGWAFKKGISISTVECYVGVVNEESGDCYRVNTVKEDRTDVTSAYNDGFDYDKSGFYTLFNKRLLREGNYEICLLYYSDNNNTFVPTGTKISIP